MKKAIVVAVIATCVSGSAFLVWHLYFSKGLPVIIKNYSLGKISGVVVRVRGVEYIYGDIAPNGERSLVIAGVGKIDMQLSYRDEKGITKSSNLNGDLGAGKKGKVWISIGPDNVIDVASKTSEGER